MNETRRIEGPDDRPLTEGFVERITSTDILGWVRQIGDDRNLVVEVRLGNVTLVRVSADQVRDDLRIAGKGDGAHGFYARFHRQISDAELELLDVNVSDTDMPIPVLGRPPKRRDVEGYVELLSRQGVQGWARSKVSNERLEIEVLTDGRKVASGVADQLRKDLAQAGKGDGIHGFSLKLAPSDVNESTIVRVLNGPSLRYISNSELHNLSSADKQMPAGQRARAEGAQARTEPVAISLLPAGEHEPAGQDLLVLEQTSSALARLKPPPPNTARGGQSGAVARAQSGARPAGAVVEGQTATPIPNISLAGGIVALRNGQLIGWAVLPASRNTILVSVDGKVAGETQASGIAHSIDNEPKLISNGFMIQLPAKLFDGKKRRIALYDAATGARVPVALDVWAFDSAPALRPQGGADSAGVVPAEQLPVSTAAPAADPITTTEAKPGRRIAVVAWDMGHNPVGRAYLLADMAARVNQATLMGPAFPFYGEGLWGPIAGSKLPMHSFPATNLTELVAGAVELARNVTCDVVHVGKPRLPSLLLGALIKHQNNCPLVLDIDDHELSFVKDQKPAGWDELTKALKQDAAQLDTPYSDLWTRFAQTLIEEVDGVTVSNVALRRRFGGVMVRHGRDERVFDPALYDRKQVRAEFGYSEADRVVLFLGTPRPHKGVFELADALESLGDDRLALCVIGSIKDKRIAARFSGYKRARIALHPDQPWHRLPELVNLADAAMILQNPADPICAYQIPAKLTDSLALDVPVFATEVPPLADVALAGAFELLSDRSSLEGALRRLAESPAKDRGNGTGRSYFLSELSYGVNAPRLEIAYDLASKNRRKELPNFERLFRFLEDRTGVALPRLVAAPPKRQGPVRARLPKDAPPRDMVFLWKQNDSGIYGRRSDMVAKYLLHSGRVRRVFHFDAPLNSKELEHQATLAPEEAANQGNLIYVNSVRRILRTADTPNFICRTFLHREGSRPERAFGFDLPPKDAYADFVRATLRDAKADENPLLWVCPVVFDFAAIADAVRPGLVVADVIDDQRTFPGSSEQYRKRVATAYSDILARADVVFSNCEPVRDGFRSLRDDIVVVPNGAELFADAERWPTSPDLIGLPRPLIGYVGNLRDRVDLELIEATAKRFPEATVLLVGSAHGRPEVSKMAGRLSNVRYLGVRPYEEAQRIIRGLDVAIMPHLKTEQSDRMNPLKLYVYFALGVPIVTTDVANIGDLARHVAVAKDREEFLVAVAAAISGKGPTIPSSARQSILNSFSWTTRIEQIWSSIETEVTKA